MGRGERKVSAKAKPVIKAHSKSGNSTSSNSKVFKRNSFSRCQRLPLFRSFTLFFSFYSFLFHSVSQSFFPYDLLLAVAFYGFWWYLKETILILASYPVSFCKRKEKFSFSLEFFICLIFQTRNLINFYSLLIFFFFLFNNDFVSQFFFFYCLKFKKFSGMLESQSLVSLLLPSSTSAATSPLCPSSHSLSPISNRTYSHFPLVQPTIDMWHQSFVTKFKCKRIIHKIFIDSLFASVIDPEN